MLTGDASGDFCACSGVSDCNENGIMFSNLIGTDDAFATLVARKDDFPIGGGAIVLRACEDFVTETPCSENDEPLHR